MEEIILQACEISKAYHYPAKVSILNNINLVVKRGETVAITGRSGEGKSTLLQILGTLEKPSSGQLAIAGQTINPFNCRKIRNQHIAFIFQSFHLLEDYTALENILMPARIARKSIAQGSKAYQRACSLLERVGLEDRAYFDTKLLSGGEKQRIAIARALCNDPDIIFADEPSGNLDKQTAQDIHQLLLDFASEKDKAIIIVTHDDKLSNLCNKKYLLEEGVLKLNSSSLF
ncbi:Lipoprotein-releasing system ATP-binding protein LolD [Neochlamydia sp. TUME1]|uniref:ABC transporter ATP-binding protein n=1 Tax=Neochlamydia sp. TUME1 TaxID=1478174 RepID=UPI00057FD894|nr:ABC transporter ATP-binding protein [Neochlamydia sp. TUME1]KIC76364.1 Lipoprotein-releasing system ATP-binding protein LolD [Neochlamydia sp. TUME1]